MSEDSPTPRTEVEDGLRWLVCPVCRAGLRLEQDRIRCAGCGRRYPVVDGIPVLLSERAV